MTDWKRHVGLGGVMPGPLEGTECLGTIEGYRDGRPASHQLFNDGTDEGFYVYQWVWAEEIQSAIGQVRGPMTCYEVQGEHPEFGLIVVDSIDGEEQ